MTLHVTTLTRPLGETLYFRRQPAPTLTRIWTLNSFPVSLREFFRVFYYSVYLQKRCYKFFFITADVFLKLRNQLLTCQALQLHIGPPQQKILLGDEKLFFTVYLTDEWKPRLFIEKKCDQYERFTYPQYQFQRQIFSKLWSLNSFTAGE